MNLSEIKLLSNEFSREREYWVKKLSGDITSSNFSFDFTKNITPDEEYQELKSTLPISLSDKLISASNDSDYKLFMILVTGLINLIYRFNWENEIIIGSAINKQKQDDNFINTILIFRNRIEEDKTFKDLLFQIKEEIIESSQHQNYPLETLPYELNNLNRDVVPPLFNIGILLENIQEKKYIEKIRLNILFSFIREQNQIYLKIKYKKCFYKHETIQLINDYFVQLLVSSLNHPNTKLSHLELITKEEKDRLLFTINDTKDDSFIGQNVISLFINQTRLAPNNIAIIDNNRTFTYSELHATSSKIATLLLEKKILPGDVIILLGHRSIEMLSIILAIHKIRAVYLPINVQDPSNRIEYIIKDSQASLIITEGHVISKHSQVFKKYNNIFLLEDIVNCLDKVKPIDDSIIQIHANDLAYIIYTSGTSGYPKGVMIEQRSLLNYINWSSKTYVKNENVAFPFYSSFAFDLTITSIFTPLITGNTIIVYGGEEKEFILEKVITDNLSGVIKVTPSHLKVVREKRLTNTSIKRFIVGGEAFEAELAKAISICSENSIEIFNEYGPTETTVGCMIFKYDQTEIYNKTIPIGVPIENSEVYVMDEFLTLTPIGICGELYIGGAGLARGYLNKPELTHERFIDNPYRKGEKIYKTGDKVRWLSNGNIEFLSRFDNQVKIRGYRIEIDEIENQLKRLEYINDALIVVNTDKINNPFLAAYYVSDLDLSTDDLKKTLSGYLPDYMIPSFFKRIEKIPLTINGKVDTKALPKIKNQDEYIYVAPESDDEKFLVDIWSEVLEIEKEKISVNESFFNLGGHSLNATTLIAKINKKLNIKVPMVEVFSKPTIREFASSYALFEKSTFTEIEKGPIKEYYALSSSQKRLFFLQQMNINSIEYNIPFALELIGKVDIQKLENAFNELINRHESLKTTFLITDDGAVQKIIDSVEFKLEYYENTSEFKKIIESFIRPFDLSKLPLWRVGVIKINEERHILMLDSHHIVSDGISMDIIIRELIGLYKGEKLKDLRIQYKDYSEWQSGNLCNNMLLNQEKFWLQTLQDDLPILNLPYDFNRPAIKTHNGNLYKFRLTFKETKALKELASSTGTTLFMILLAVYKITLSKISGQEDIIIGTPIAGRRHSDLDKIVGIFINMIPLRNQLKGEFRFLEFLEVLKKRTIDAYENQDYPFENLVGKISVERDLSLTPIFQTIFMLQNVKPINVTLQDLQIRPYEFDYHISKFDLSLYCLEEEEAISFIFEYNTDLFKEYTINKFATYFNDVISEILLNNQIKISEISIINSEEKHKILYEFNNTSSHLPSKSIIHYFEEQVEKVPDQLAICDDSHSYSYKELNYKANQLAHTLEYKNIKSNCIVALMVERSPEMVVSILAILKVGGTWMPLDPEFPKDRIKYMLEDSKVNMLLTTHSGYSSKEISNLSIDVLFLDEKDSYHVNNKNVEIKRNLNDVIYIIYTSGTTGYPKGVLIENHSLVNRLKWMQDFYPLSNDDTILQKTPYTFDVSVWELLWWSFAGAKLALLKPGGEKDPSLIVKAIKTFEITTIHFVPSMLKAFMEYIIDIDINLSQLATLKKVFSSGEALTSDRVEQFNSIFKDADIQLINLYGPTEATIDVTFYNCEKNSIIRNIPIGRPISNTKTYILDKNEKPVPIGNVGELCISGVNLSRGYLNNPELSAKKFINSPFQSGEKIYKTGDLCRWLSDGNIEYLGRIDHQVKLKGFRIELLEIEKHLINHKEIKDSVVTIHQDKNGEKSLCAYYISQNEIPSNDLQEYMASKVPNYMVPLYFMHIQEFPLTSSGKIDKKKLPKPSVKSLKQYVPPKTDIEKLLIRIWEEVLNVEKIGMNDNYFELGGDSIKALHIISKLYKEKLKLELQYIFSFPVFNKLVKFITTIDSIADQGTVSGTIDIHPVIKQTLINDIKSLNDRKYSILLHKPYGFIKDTLKDTFIELIEHHDALRITLLKNESKNYSLVNREIVSELFEFNEIPVEKNEDIISFIETQTLSLNNFNIENEYLLKATIFKSVSGDYLLISTHQLGFDYYSWRIFLKDFNSFYQLKHQKKAISASFKTHSYKDWINLTMKRLEERKRFEIIEYLNKITETKNIYQLKYNKESNKKDGYKNITIKIKEQTNDELEIINKTYNASIKELLLLSLGLTLNNITEESIFLIDVENNARENSNIDISNTIGHMLYRYPILLTIENKLDLPSNIKGIKNIIHNVPDYGVDHYMMTDDPELSNFSLNPDIKFSYYGEIALQENNLFNTSTIFLNAVEFNDIEYKLSIKFFISNNVLIMNLLYNTNVYLTKNIEQLINTLKENYNKIIKHCLEKPYVELSISDLSSKNIDQEDLSAVYNVLQNLK